MSAPLGLLRSASHRARKIPSPTVPSLTRYPPSYVVRQSSISLATVNHDERVLPEVGFTGSTCRPSISNPGADDPHKKPDERTLKLGKSKSSLCRLSWIYLANN
jgi:hypothetical protein